MERWTTLFALTVTMLGCAQQRTLRIDPQPTEIKLTEGLVQIVPDRTPFDSPILSPDGKRLAVQVEVYASSSLPYEIYSLGVSHKNDANTWQPIDIVRLGKDRAVLGQMVMPIQPCFDNTGEILYLTWITFDSFLRIPLAPSIRSWIERMPWQGGEPTRVIEYDDWGMHQTELIQHPRISPDGKWLTFYTRVHQDTQGSYLLNLETNEHYRLSHDHDKHPSWDPSGNRIWFHHCKGGKRHRFDFFASGVEQSVIGYYDLTFDSNRLVKSERVLMDEFSDRFIYHKHPTIVAGMNLLVFHGDLEPNGQKKLLVRKPTPGSPIFEIEPRFQGQKLKAIKHPCSSFDQPDLVFIAKPKGEQDYNLLMALTPEALESVRQVVHNTPPPQ